MEEKQRHFVEACLYEVKPEKTGDFEDLVNRVANHHRQFPGVIDVRYIKRSHRPVDFDGARRGKPAIRLTKTGNYYLCPLLGVG